MNNTPATQANVLKQRIVWFKIMYLDYLVLVLFSFFYFCFSCLFVRREEKTDTEEACDVCIGEILVKLTSFFSFNFMD